MGIHKIPPGTNTGDWAGKFPPEAQRLNEGKPQLSYLLTFPKGVEALGWVMQYGAEKYARGNYLLGAGATQYMDSLLRHLLKIQQGELIDPESGCPHIGHALFNAMMLAEVTGEDSPNNDLLNKADVLRNMTQGVEINGNNKGSSGEQHREYLRQYDTDRKVST